MICYQHDWRSGAPCPTCAELPVVRPTLTLGTMGMVRVVDAPPAFIRRPLVLKELAEQPGCLPEQREYLLQVVKALRAAHTLVRVYKQHPIHADLGALIEHLDAALPK